METITLLILGGIIIALIIERHLYSKEMNRQIGEATRAVLSKNINEFMQATKPQEASKTEFIRDEEVNMDEATEDEFLKGLGIKS